VEAGTVFTSKPAGGSADLTFTRSNDTATRVGPNGYIEKVRTNLLLQSNQFDTTWTTYGSPVLTSGQAGYDGSSDAWTLSNSGLQYDSIRQNVSTSGVYTFSVYAKANTLDYLILGIIVSSGSNVFQWFDLSTGSIASDLYGNVIYASMDSLGGGWYRCTVAANATTVNLVIYPTSADADFAPTAGNIYIQDAQYETGDIATGYIETTTAAVTVGPVANVPRINFDPVLPRTGSLLLEPQRTNLALYSEQFDNAYWTKTASTTITANANVSPSGYQDADTYTTTAIGIGSQIYRVISVSGTTQTLSIFIKYLSGSGTNLRLSIGSVESLGVNLTFSNSGATLTGVKGSSVNTLNIENYGNNWFRVSISVAYASAFAEFNLFRYAGSGTDAYAIWGAQLEPDSPYPTSYIPTYGAAVTRGADACYKTGISSVIGQTEGSIFFDFVFNGLSNTSGAVYPLLLSDASGAERFEFVVSAAKALVVYALDNSSIIAEMRTSNGYMVEGTRYKVGISYSTIGGLNLYINGTLIGTDTLASIPSNTNIYLNDFQTTSIYQGLSDYNKVLLFQTRLTNDQLSQITTL